MLEFAEAEVERLQAELEKTPAYKRLMAAKDLIATYRGNPEVAAPAAVPAAAPAKFTPAEFVTMARTKTAQVDGAAAEYLAQRGRRATSGELLPVVQAKGITITGKTPSKTLSSYLSNSKRFDNVPGFGGYGLVEWGGRRTAPSAMPAQPGTPNEIVHDGGKLPLNS
jgi:outer membrane protein TolC